MNQAPGEQYTPFIIDAGAGERSRTLSKAQPALANNRRGKTSMKITALHFADKIKLLTAHSRLQIVTRSKLFEFAIASR
jgi:hypothetical protein